MDAVTIMDSILRNMPQKTERINLIKSGLINSISSSFPNFRNVSSSIDRGRQRGYTESPLKKQFELYKTLTFEEINEFYETNIQNKPRIITIYGNAESIDKKELAKYGKIITLKIDDIIVE